MTKQLPFEESKQLSRDSFRWQAYLSSALTIDKEEDRERIKRMNATIKDLLEDKADTFVYLPQEYSDPSRGDKMRPEEIYVLDRWRIAEADFVLVNLNRPAFGVGQETEMASSVGIPIIAFHHESIRPSRLIRGVPVIFLREGLGVPSDSVISYSDIDYSDLLPKLLAYTKRLQTSREPLEEFETPPHSFSRSLKQAMEAASVDVSELSERTAFSETFLHHLLSDFDTVKSLLEPYEILVRCRLRNISTDRFVNPGLWVLRTISQALDCSISNLLGEQELNQVWLEPLTLAGKRGVTLSQFAEVANTVGYQLLYEKAARSLTRERGAEAIAQEICDAAAKRGDT